MKKTMIRILSLILIGAFLPCMAQAAIWNLENGDITVSATETKQTVSQNGTSTDDNAPVITSNGNSTNNTLTINAEEKATAKVTLDKVNIDVSTEQKAAITTDGKGDVTLNLSGDNSVKSGDHHAGVHKENTGNLTITTSEGTPGSLNAAGGKGGAGIGGGDSGSGTDIQITDGKVTATGGEQAAGIGGGNGGSGSNITISGGEVEAQGGTNGAGIGGGEGASGNDITISGGQVTAIGGDSGAGIGGGGGKREGSGNITVSGEAQVKAQGGRQRNEADNAEGWPIGNGGFVLAGIGVQGGEITPNTTDLKVDGFIHYYSQFVDVKTAEPYEIINGTAGDHNWDEGQIMTQPTCTTPGEKIYTCTKNPSHTKTETIPALEHLFETYVYNQDATTEADGTETAHCARPGCTVTDTRTAKGTRLQASTQQTTRQSPYWVTDPDGQNIPCQAQQKDGVLTITVSQDNALLHSTTQGLEQLKSQGITEIRFVTAQTQSAFALADLLASGSGSVTLTHTGKQVTFTLEDKDISSILK